MATGRLRDHIIPFDLEITGVVDDIPDGFIDQMVSDACEHLEKESYKDHMPYFEIMVRNLIDTQNYVRYNLPDDLFSDYISKLKSILYVFASIAKKKKNDNLTNDVANFLEYEISLMKSAGLTLGEFSLKDIDSLTSDKDSYYIDNILRFMRSYNGVIQTFNLIDGATLSDFSLNRLKSGAFSKMRDWNILFYLF